MPSNEIPCLQCGKSLPEDLGECYEYDGATLRLHDGECALRFLEGRLLGEGVTFNQLQSSMFREAFKNALQELG